MGEKRTLQKGTDFWDAPTLAQRLRMLRIHNELTQQEVADLLHISRSAYTYYETGKCVPPIQSLVFLSKTFQVKLEDLLPY